MKIKFDKANITMSISILLVCVILVSISFIQFKTVEQVNETDIENMRDEELREQISSWKSKWEEANEKLEDTNTKISEYQTKIESNEEASELLDEELKKSQLLLGTTDVTGEGVVVTLTDTEESSITADDLITLVNELRFAGAEAISINGVRVMPMTDIVDIDSYIIIKPSQRIVSPYVVKAIGNQTYLVSTLCLKNSGYVDKYNNSGKSVKLEKQKNIKIPKYTGNMDIKGCLIGALIGMYAPMVSYTYSGYLAIAIIAALDSVFGGIVATLKKNFNLTIFVTGFFGNAILAILLTILGQKLNVDIYLAAIIVFVGRMFTNLAIIRRYYIDIVVKKIEDKKSKKDNLKEEKTE